MAEDQEASILYSCGSSSIEQYRLDISFSISNNRKILPEALELDIETIWSERCAANPTLWNGSKFRFNSLTTDVDGRLVFLGLNYSKKYVCFL